MADASHSLQSPHTPHVDLLTAPEIRKLADTLDIRPTKTLGQNFVIDPNTVRRIVAAAHLKPHDTVVEIGPGLGSLTLALAETGAQVTAVEIDPRLAEQLPTTFQSHAPEASLRVITKDAMHVTAEEILHTGHPAPTALVANLPYNVAVPVLLHMLDCLLYTSDAADE